MRAKFWWARARKAGPWPHDPDHRPPTDTIKDYDRILVLGAEGIEESGTHDELLAKKGVYYRLWNQLPGEDTL